jgi:hypothetical protein
MQQGGELQPRCKLGRARMASQTEGSAMTNLKGWRTLLTVATIDAVLVFAAGTATAAPAAALPAPGPALPVLLLLGVGLVGTTLRRGIED